MNDETYCVADFSRILGQEYYVAEQKGTIDENFKTTKASKYPEKYLVWQALCSCGLKSKEFVTKGYVNGDIYVNECLKKRLLPLIKMHSMPILFWPDLASCHYGKVAKKFYQDSNINIVPKEANLPNCLELRPIEKYWAHVKRKLKTTKYKTSSIAEFQKIWRTQSKSITNEDV